MNKTIFSDVVAQLACGLIYLSMSSPSHADGFSWMLKEEKELFAFIFRNTPMNRPRRPKTYRIPASSC